LALNGNYIVELFSFPNPPKRPSRPESCGLRHLALKSTMWNKHVLFSQNNIPSENIRMDEYTGKQFFFVADLMIYQSSFTKKQNL
jgi:glyoxylase I family protein